MAYESFQNEIIDLCHQMYRREKDAFARLWKLLESVEDEGVEKGGVMDDEE